jgi:uroporphyrinogen-III decarboxylase
LSGKTFSLLIREFVGNGKTSIDLMGANNFMIKSNLFSANRVGRRQELHMALKRIKGLIDEMRRAPEDPHVKMLYEERRIRWRKWSEVGIGNKDIPRPTITAFSRPHDWANELGFDLLEYYSKPESYLENTLRISLYAYKYISPLFVAPYDFDEAALKRIHVGIDFGGAFEPSLLGVETVFRSDGTPWPGRPIVQDEKDLTKLRIPDFEKSGLMPKVHYFHDELERIGKQLGEEIVVSYPSWTRGPWGVAVHMMGWQNALLNIVKKPRFIHKLLAFITDARIAWEKDRAAYLGQEVPRTSSLSNDEVGCKLFSARTYRDVILPYEKQLSDFYPEGISYFHSCNDITAFLPDIIQIRGMKTVHVSPWTDLKTAVNVLRKGFEIQKWMHPEDMILSDEEKRLKLKEVLTTATSCRMTVINAGAVRHTIDWLKAIHSLVDAPEKYLT